jgi:hypothetical protein
VTEKRKATRLGDGRQKKKKRTGKDTSTCVGDSVQGDPAKDFIDMEVDVVEPLSHGSEEENKDTTSRLVSVVFFCN